MQRTFLRQLLTPCLVLALCGLFSSGCSFFEEIPLGDEEETQSTTSSDTQTDAGNGCVRADDRCDSQDVVRWCEGVPPQLQSLSCDQSCTEQGQVNAACVLTNAGLYGCWCVSPSPYDLSSCTTLETCLGKCGGETFSDCGNRCFARADASTTRLYGALLNCAQTDCRETCVNTPAACATCIEAALSGQRSNCTTQRALCDQDRTPEEM